MSNQPDGMINDWFDFGGSKVMDAFMSLFPVFDLVLDKCLKENDMAFCPELLHRKMVDFFDKYCTHTCTHTFCLAHSLTHVNIHPR